MKRFVFLLCFLCFTIAGYSQPLEMITLKDGSRLYGYIQKQDTKNIVFHTDFAYRIIPKMGMSKDSDFVDLAAWKSDEDVSENYEYVKRLDSSSIVLDGNRIRVITITDGNGKVCYSGALEAASTTKNASVVRFWDLKATNESIPIADMERVDKQYVSVNDPHHLQNTYDIDTNFGVYDEYLIKSEDGSSDMTKYKGMVISQETGKNITISLFNPEFSSFLEEPKSFKNSSISRLERKAINPDYTIFEQSKHLDVVVKKDGIEYKGVITERDFDDLQLTIETEDKDIKVLSMRDVASYGKEVNPKYSVRESLTQAVEAPAVVYKYWINDDDTTPMQYEVKDTCYFEKAEYRKNPHMVIDNSIVVRTDNPNADIVIIELQENENSYYFTLKDLSDKRKKTKPNNTEPEVQGEYRAFSFNVVFTRDKDIPSKFYAIIDTSANTVRIIELRPR